MRFGILMVAGIFEKSKRLRKVLFFDIRRLPISQAQLCRAPNCGMWRETRAEITLKTLKNLNRHEYARRDKIPHRRQLRRMAKKLNCSVPRQYVRPVPFRLPCETAAVPIRGELG